MKRRRPTVIRDTPASVTPRPLVKGDVVRDPHFPLALSVYSHVERRDTGVVLVFSQGDNFCHLSGLKYGALEHADGAPIDPVGLDGSAS